MPRTKKPSQRGNYRGGGGRARGGQSSNGTDSLKLGHAGFTLQEEARNTERHHSFWDTDKRLRDTKVAFVSAGTLGSTKPNDAEAALADMTLDYDDTDDIQPHNLSESSAAARDLTDPQFEQAILRDSTEIQAIPDFIVDIEGGDLVHTRIPQPRLRSLSPTPSDSSEEIILFRGRDQHGRGLSEAPRTTRTTDTIDAKIRIVEDRIHEREELLQEVLRRKEHSILPQTPVEVPSAEKETESQRHKQPGHPVQQNRVTPRKQANEDAILADYIANMESQDKEPFENLRLRELGGTADGVWQEPGDSSGDAVTRSKKPSQAGWNSSEICDLDDMSTSDGVMGDVLAILSRRERQTGLQYLVVWEDQTVDEARWVPVNTLTSLSALRHIEKFEVAEKLVAEFQHDDDDDISDTEESNVEDDAREDDEDNEDDEEGFIEKRTERMSDEQIARLLAKQEELGMGSAGLMLFDEEAGVDEDEDLPFPRTLLAPIMLPSNKRRPRGAGSQRARGDFPQASLLADAYDGFDVMDFDRPSLKRKPKGRKGKPDFDLSDSEFEASMQMAWENDRVKKKGKKQEREELRAQGLLGSKNGKPALKQKYKEGMGIHAVKEELKKFLMGTDTTLALPPMDAADRKVVHELARAFNVKSKSAGSGNVRFPVWHRTMRTSVYVERNFNAIEERLSRRFLPRLDVVGKKSGIGLKRVKGGGVGGSNKASVSYRDGDVVGGSAPELGAENRGRAMLEKMGWSSGTALGALNNKGILQPVSHVVKTTKAGLG